MARGVDEVEHVGAAVRAGPGQPDGLALDRDAALALDVHPVQVLRAHLAVLDHAGELQHPVRERGLAVVDVRDDAEVADHAHDRYDRVGQRAAHQPGGRSGTGGTGIRQVRDLGLSRVLWSHAGSRCPRPAAAAPVLSRAARSGYPASSERKRCSPLPLRRWIMLPHAASAGRDGTSRHPDQIPSEASAWRTSSPRSSATSRTRRRRQRNKAVKSELKTSVRKFREAADAGDAEAATRPCAPPAVKLDKAASKGVIHKNQAANRKSAIAKRGAELRQRSLSAPA